MPMSLEETEIWMRFRELIQAEFGDSYFPGWLSLLVKDPENETGLKSKKIFQWLFAQGEDAKTFLWNSLFLEIEDEEIEGGKKVGLSQEEIAFLSKIKKTRDRLDAEMDTEGDPSWRNINDPLAASRITLRPYDMALVNAYYAHFVSNPEEFCNYYSLDSMRGSGWQYQNNRPFAFAVVSNESGDFIGSVALHPEDEPGVYNIEWYIVPEERGKGYAKEAFGRLLSAIRDSELKYNRKAVRRGVYEVCVPDIKVLHAEAREDNLPSAKLAEALGFEFIGLSPTDREYRGKPLIHKDYRYPIEKAE